MSRAFVLEPVHRGPQDPPTLGAYVEYRSESAPLCFWAKRENGELAGRFRSMAEAQQALGQCNRKEATNG